MTGTGGGGGGGFEDRLSEGCAHTRVYAYPGGGGGSGLESLQFRFCTTFLYAICSVVSRICAGVRWASIRPEPTGK